jgi:hypothetical protein
VIKSGKSVTVHVHVTLLMTTNIERKIKFDVEGLGSHLITIKLVGELSTKLDPDDIITTNPPIGTSCFLSFFCFLSLFCFLGTVRVRTTPSWWLSMPEMTHTRTGGTQGKDRSERCTRPTTVGRRWRPRCSTRRWTGASWPSSKSSLPFHFPLSLGCQCPNPGADGGVVVMYG